MVQTNSKPSTEGVYQYCQYHIYSVKHTNHHHVLIQTDDLDLIKTLDADVYQYCLISSQQVFLDPQELGGVIIRGLVMDGESLLRRFKAQQNKTIQTKTKE